MEDTKAAKAAAKLKATARSFIPTLSDSIRASLVLVLLAAVFLGGSYLLSVRSKTRYFTERNLRQLASVGRQLDNAIRRHERVLENFSRHGLAELRQVAGLEFDLQLQEQRLEQEQRLVNETTAQASAGGGRPSRIESLERDLAEAEELVALHEEEKLFRQHESAADAGTVPGAASEASITITGRDLERAVDDLEAQWRGLVPLFDEVAIGRCRRDAGEGSAAPPVNWLAAFWEALRGEPSARAVSLLEGTRLHVQVAGRPLPTTLNAAGSGDGEGGLEVCASLRLEKLLRPIFEDDVFDALLLSRPDGEVVYQSESSKLILTRIDHLSKPLPDEEEPPPFDQLARTTQVLDVSVSGKLYKLFLQPQVFASLRSPSATAGDDAVRSGAGNDFLVAGLVEARSFRYATLAVSSNILVLLVFLTVILASSYPFLKIRLLSRRQPLRFLDALLLLVSLFLGFAVLILFLLDVVAYRVLVARSEGQLAHMARQLEESFEREVRCAYAQLAELQEPALRAYRAWLGRGSAADVGKCRISTGNCPELLSDDKMGIDPFSPYPYLRNLALVNGKAEQVMKWNADRRVAPRISVAERAYARDALAGESGLQSSFRSSGGRDQADRGPSIDAGPFYLESIFSMTDGEARAVLAKRLSAAGLESAGGAGRDDPRLITMLLPMLSVIDPVIPRDFGFAVIDSAGEVLFHSEKHLNLSQNLLTETDDDGDLRAALFTRFEQPLELVYGGRDRHAYVLPMRSFPWSVVTFYDQAVLRGVNLDTLVTSGLLLVVYFFLYAAAGLLALWYVPDRLRSWIWPRKEEAKKKEQETAYAVLTVLLLGPALLQLVAILLLDGGLLVTVAAVLGPGLAAAAAVFVSRSKEHRILAALGKRLRTQRRGLAGAYVRTGFVLLVIVVVLPVAAFFKAGYRVQLESLVKYHQLQLARDLEERRQRLRAEYSDARGMGKAALFDQRASLVEPYDVVAEFLYATRFDAEPGGIETMASRQPAPAPLLHGSLERLLPHYDARSAAMRGLLSDRSRWRRLANDRLRFEPPGSRLAVESRVRPFAMAALGPVDVLVLAGGLIALVVLLRLLYSAVGFVAARVLLVDLEPPEWIDGQGKLRSLPPRRFLLVSDKDLETSAAATFREIDAASVPARTWREELKECFQSSESVLVRRFDLALADAGLAGQVLDLVDELDRSLGRTVVLESRRMPAELLAVSTGDEKTRAALQQRVASCLGRCVVVQVPWLRPTDCPRPPAPGLGEWTSEHARQLVEAECPSYDRILSELKNAVGRLFLRGATPTRKQVLEEVGERAESYYKELWDTCNDDEKSVLFHVAREGLVNTKNRRALRRLLGRRMIRLCPAPTLVNESFRRFVLAPERHRYVGALNIGDSAWNRLRGPLGLVAAGTIVFVVTTQQDFFDTTVALLGGLTATVPVVLRLLGFLNPKPDGNGSQESGS